MARPGRGSDAERRAVWWYRLRGYRVLETNAWAGGYELDVVVRRGRRLVFCEVKEKGETGSASRWRWSTPRSGAA